MAKAKKKVALTLEERLVQALVPEAEQPYPVPKNWCWIKVGHVVQLCRGVSYKKDDAHKIKSDNDCLVMRGGNIQEGNIDINVDNVYINKSFVSSEQLVRKYDIIIVSSTGSSKVIGRAGISFDNFNDVAFGAFLTLVRPQEKVIKPFVAKYFQTDIYRERIRQLAGGVNINNIRGEYILESPFPLPPLNEQQRIVDRVESLFAKLDEAKEKAQTALDSFETRKAAILHKAFTGELTAKWREENPNISNSTINDISLFAETLPKKYALQIHECQKKISRINLSGGHIWYLCNIGAVAMVVNGSTPSRKECKFWNGNIPWVSSGEVRNNEIEITNEKITETGFNESSVRLHKPGTVLIAMIGEGKTRGQSAILKINATINQNIAAINLEHGKVVPKFMWYWLQLQYKKNREKGAGSGPQALNCQRVRKLEFLVPTLKEQLEIVRILDDFFIKEQKAKELCSILDKIDLIKKSLLTRAFRGELGTNAPTEESALELLKSIV